MCGRGYAPRFLFSWPGAKTAVMGGEQAARTMQIVAEAGMARKGITPDPEKMQVQFDKIVALFEAQADALLHQRIGARRRRDRPRVTRARCCRFVWTPVQKPLPGSPAPCLLAWPACEGAHMATDLKHMLALDAAHQLGEWLASAGAPVHQGQWQAGIGGRL